MQFSGRRRIARNVPYAPYRPILAPQAPKRESVDAQHLCGAHVVQGRNRIEKPDVVAQAALVQITEMRIQRIIVKGHILFGIARFQPGLLHRDTVVFNIGRQPALLWLEHPVVAIVGDGADKLFPGNDVHGELEIVDEPVLRGDRPGGSAGIMLVVVHDYNAVRGRCDRGVVEFLIVRRHADIELHSSGVQIRRQFVQHRDIAWLSDAGEGLKIHHQAAEAVRGKKHCDLLAKNRAGRGTV